MEETVKMGLFKKKNEPTVIGENSSKNDSNKVGFFKKVGGFLKKHIKLIIILCIIVFPKRLFI